MIRMKAYITLVFSIFLALNCYSQTKEKKIHYMRNGAVFIEIKDEYNSVLTNEYGDTIANANSRYGMFQIDNERQIIKVSHLYGEIQTIINYKGELLAKFQTNTKPLVWIDGNYFEKIGEDGSTILDSKGYALYYKKHKYPHFTRLGLKFNSEYLVADFTKDYSNICKILNKGKWLEALNKLQPFVNDSLLWAVYLKGHLLRFGNKEYISDNKLLYNNLTDEEKKEGLNLLCYAANKNSIPAIYEVFLEYTNEAPELITPNLFNYVKGLYDFYGEILNIKIRHGLSKCYLEGYGTNKDIIKAYTLSSSYTKTTIETLDHCYYEETKIVDSFLKLSIDEKKEYFPEDENFDENDMCARGLLEYCRNPKSAEAAFWFTCAARYGRHPDALYLISEMVKDKEVYTGMSGDKHKYWLNLAADQGSKEALKILHDFEITEENAKIEQAKQEEEREARRVAIAEALVLGIVNTTSNLATSISNYQNLKRNSKYSLNTLNIKNVSQKNNNSSSSTTDDDDDDEDDIDHSGHKHGPKGHGKACRYCKTSGHCRYCDGKGCSVCHQDGDCTQCGGHGYVDCHHEND